MLEAWSTARTHTSIVCPSVAVIVYNLNSLLRSNRDRLIVSPYSWLAFRWVRGAVRPPSGDSAGLIQPALRGSYAVLSVGTLWRIRRGRIDPGATLQIRDPRVARSSSQFRSGQRGQL